MKKSKSSPSRIKYEKSHPTVSARLPKEKREKLLSLLKTMDITQTQLLLHFIDEYEIKIMPVEEARKKGFLEAKAIYMVTYNCPKCGTPIPIVGDSAKQAASKYMAEHGWGHTECSKREP